MLSGASAVQQLFKVPPLLIQNMVQIQQNIGLSNNGMKKLGAALNHVNLLDWWSQTFSRNLLKQISVSQAPKTNLSLQCDQCLSLWQHIRQVVHCHSLIDLSDRFIVSRNLNASAIVKLGIDGGGSFLKVSFTHIQMQDDESPLHNPVQKTVKLMSPQILKTTSGKQQLLFVLSQDTPEAYHKVKAIFDSSSREVF